MEVATLLHGAAALESDRARVSADAAWNLLALCAHAATIAGGCGWVVGPWRGCGEVGDVLGDWVARADAGDADIRGFAGFTESVVARVKVFTLLVLK